MIMGRLFCYGWLLTDMQNEQSDSTNFRLDLEQMSNGLGVEH